MSHHDSAPLGAIANQHAHLKAACRELALIGIAAALAACSERANPTAPQHSPAVDRSLAAAEPSVAPTELTSDAIVRILPALEQDAAAPVDNALRALDAKLRDADATAGAKDRAAATVQNVLAQFTDPARADAADLDAMRLEVDQIRASLP
jgi:hypothetical protein